MNTFIRRLAADVPLLMDSALAYIVSRDFTGDDIRMAEHPSFTRLRESMAAKLEMKDGLAIVPVQGALAYNPDPYEMLFDGVEDSRSVIRMIEEAKGSKECKGMLLRMDTPGGMMLGGPEIADAVYRFGKPVVAHIGGIGASLGYMIASQADEVIANRSAIVGSIGVIASVADYTALLARLGIKMEVFTNKDAKFKGAGAVGTSLTADQRENIQQGIESAFNLFKTTVLSKRPNIKAEVMRGQTFRGEEALTVGLIDRIGSETFALGILRQKT